MFIFCPFPICGSLLSFGGYNSPLSHDLVDFLGITKFFFGIYIFHGTLNDMNSPSIATINKTKVEQLCYNILGCVNCAKSNTDMVMFIYHVYQTRFLLTLLFD